MTKLHLSAMLIIAFVCLNSGKVFSISAKVKGSVSSLIPESSGLDFSGGSSFYTHNDGYGDNRIYKISMTGGFSKSITVNNATNNDWEDITHDEGRTRMFIGDFGNNNCSRTNLKIYVIPYPSTISGTSVAASIIKFSYPDQKKFPSKWLNFDVEAFFHRNGKLYLFTKADGNAIGYTKLYTVPDAPGTYVATLVDSFATSKRITGAAISPDGLTAALISNTKLYLFRDFTGTNIFNGNVTKLSIDGGWTQKEGVAFYDDETVYLIDEGSSHKLYSIDITPYISTARLAAPKVSEEEKEVRSLSMFPNPASTFTTIEFSKDENVAKVVFSDLSGRIVKELAIQNDQSSIRLELEDLPAGMYTVMIVSGQRRQSLMLSVSH